MSHQIVPLLDIAEYTDNVRLMKLDLPGVPVEDLNVDVTRLNRAMHWGGIGLLAIGSYEGEGTEYTATNVAMGPDGSLVGTGTKIAKKAKISSPQSQDIARSADYRWRNTAIYFNSTALDEREADPNVQTKALDRALRTSLLADIGSHEMAPKNLVGEAGMAFYYTCVGKILMGSRFGYSDGWIDSMVNFMEPKVWLPPVMMAFHKLLPRHNSATEIGLPAKNSLMFSWKFDRAALASRHLTRRIIFLDKAQDSE